MAEIDGVIQLPQRKLVISQNELYLNTNKSNKIFVLMVEESRGSAGGRAAGSGSRRIDRIYGYSCEDGTCSQIFETDEQTKIELFDIPYSAVAMDIRLSDGRPFVVQGVVDSELVSVYLRLVGNVK
ncbi:MAG: hypothetical protein ACRD99_05580 [Nitrososphaera sp.]